MRATGFIIERTVVMACLAASLATTLAAEEWYDAYELGIEALDHRKPVEAVEAFERAILKNPKPGTNVLVYGTNRLDRYYPYLRLAEAFLMLGDAEGTRQALELSIKYGRESEIERAALTRRLKTLIQSRAATTRPSPLSAETAAVARPMPSMTPTPAAPAKISTPAPVVGTLDLASKPIGAAVFIDGRRHGVTPLRVELSAGAHTVSLRKEGYVEQMFPVRIADGELTTERRTLVDDSAPPLPVTDATLIVRSRPQGAAVYLDGELLGTTDLRSGRLQKSGIAPGKHELRISRPGYEDEFETIEIGVDGPTQHTAVLRIQRGMDRRILVLVGALAAGGGVLIWRRASGGGGAFSDESRPSPPLIAASTESSEPVKTTTYALEALSKPVPATLASTERFGEYLLHCQIGAGGMATVFKAEKRGEICALKRPLLSMLDDRGFHHRFLREAEIGRTLHHPTIVRIFEQGEVEGVPYFTMELIEGHALSVLVRLQGPLEPRTAVLLISQVAEALDYAHLKGVVHRDLKPSNIMVARDGAAKVMDYGIARARRFSGLTITRGFLGTPEYIAPESAEDGVIDARSDLYSLGVVFYEILTGLRPFVGNTPFATVRKHCTEPPTPPSAIRSELPDALEAITLRLLQKDPSRRYQTAEDLLVDLREYLNSAA